MTAPQSLLEEPMRRRLVEMYGAPDRHYHSLSHIEVLLQLARRHADLVVDAAALEAAIWFHDAILDTHRGDNEKRSADLARKWLSPVHGAPRAEPVALMIEATANHRPAEDAAPALGAQIDLFLDMDLSILGETAARFDAYEVAVRLEYDWVAEEDWRHGRAQVLRRFLDRPRIFATDRFHLAYEDAARANISRSLARLG